MVDDVEGSDKMRDAPTARRERDMMRPMHVSQRRHSPNRASAVKVRRLRLVRDPHHRSSYPQVFDQSWLLEVVCQSGFTTLTALRAAWVVDQLLDSSRK